MKKSEAIRLLQKDGWTKADAQRALATVDFKLNPDELFIRRAISPFAGSELHQRQRLQSTQKRLVTINQQKIERNEKEYLAKLEEYKKQLELEKQKLPSDENLKLKIKQLENEIRLLSKQRNELIRVNDQLKKDNKALKNIVDALKLKLTINIKHLLNYKDSEIRKELVKLLHSVLG